jgi:hypothetical protein
MITTPAADRWRLAAASLTPNGRAFVDGLHVDAIAGRTLSPDDDPMEV